MMKKPNPKIWILIYLIMVTAALVIVAMQVIRVDPFFHYHLPNTDSYYYILNNERSQNDGITKHFDYDTLITGTSMTQNFKTSEMDEIFGTNSIKVPYSGASYKEINDNLIVALNHNKNLKTIVRGLDMGKFIHDKDTMRHDQGDYPTYLYDDNIFNDIHYIFNRDVIFNRAYPMMLANDSDDFKGGITSFDAYSNWMAKFTFGLNTVYPDLDEITIQAPGEPIYLTDEEKSIVIGTAQQNITSLAKEYPDVTFYYFFTPYSVVWWKSQVDSGTIYKQLEAEKIVIEQMLECDNIRLFSFNNLTDIITDLNNYKDSLHYGSWVNSLMLKYMYDDRCRLTYENYVEYLDYELNYYLTFDYSSLKEQADYENDYFAEALLNEKINGTPPLEFTYDLLSTGNYQNASLLRTATDEPIIVCQGSLQKGMDDETSVADYLVTNDYVGCKISVENISDYKYLVFYGQKNQDHGQPSVYIYDSNDTKVAEYTANYHDLDNEKHQYLIDVSNLTGSVGIIFNGGYVDNTGSTDSMYTFSNITLY